MDKAKLYKYYNIGIRSTIIIVALVLLYRELSNKNISEYSDILENYFQNPRFLWVLGIVILLMPINWSIEALKWKYIVSSREEISFPLALKAIFAGATVSSLSPNRVGDFLGRVFVLKKISFLQGAFITLIGSYAQTLISIIVGFLAIVFWAFKIPYWGSLDKLYLLLAVSTLFLIIIIFLYYKISVLIQIVPKSWKRIYGYIQVLSKYKYPELSIILSYSLLRYFVFSSQFVLMIWAVGLPIPIIHLYLLVSTIFIINMFRPSIALVEFAIRGAVSVGVISAYYTHFFGIEFLLSVDIILASTLIWFINIIIPAIIGLLFIKDMKFFKLRKGNT